ncbi:lipoyl(octanoyl) transferase LipB [Isachenkonia alkalipeptolytica]|uniref:Octanoyltransferase n=1 Tax=Isachenkonia alkalipeptolytica TaxID=2565777 RepID=A0AA44BEI0_9CLOT|nr:lipoyl(octanoyl) transferase LipB [Isachenkonia alkalipeptolytica]NBG89309.1 lipoyl(octanoyl) transferase LipB [Isachenkonia alkalipeptolytica]
MEKTLNLLYLGKCDYEQALEIQFQLLKKRQEGKISDTLILVEHPAVITLGKSASAENVVAPEKELARQGIQRFETNRGGDVTYHGEGQIVGYPIIHLIENQIKVRGFVEKLEKVFVNILKDFDLKATGSGKDIGVWIGNEKITAIGLAVKKGVTMHGFAFNVNTNLDHFQFIIPCGIRDKGVTTLEKLLGETQDFNQMNQRVAEEFVRVYEYEKVQNITLEELNL